ncbi:MAG: glucosaminidase domain-containing protein [Bacteroidota bacterium]
MIDYRLHHRQSKTSRIYSFANWVGKYWFQAVVSMFLIHLYLNRDVQVSLKPAATNASSFTALKDETAAAKPPADDTEELSFNPLSAVADEILEDKPANLTTKWKSSDFKNLSFVFDPKMAERKGVPDAIVKEKMQACRSYVERFAATAMAEMQQFGIPASITLAQGLLETDAGGSRLASESNNHFGIKCRSKCLGCTCRNYSDDDVYDMFRVFDSAWESFREHSKLLAIPRYQHLKKLGTTDYEGWAAGLKKAGYATDKNYDKKLVQIIEELDLAQFDR